MVARRGMPVLVLFGAGALVHALLHNVGVRSLKTAHSYITYARQEKMRRARKQKKTAGEIILSERDQKS